MFWDKVTHSVLSKACQHVSIKAISLTFLTCHNACHTGRVDNCPFLWILQPFVCIFGHKLLCCTFFILSSAISVPFITPMMLTWCANSEIYLNVCFQHFYFFPSLVQLSKSNLHALAPAQVGVDACIVHKQVNTIHLQSQSYSFSIVNLRRLRPLT